MQRVPPNDRIDRFESRNNASVLILNLNLNIGNNCPNAIVQIEPLMLEFHLPVLENGGAQHVFNQHSQTLILIMDMLLLPFSKTFI